MSTEPLRNNGKIEGTRRKPRFSATRPPWTSHGVTRDWTWGSALRSQVLTLWAICHGLIALHELVQRRKCWNEPFLRKLVKFCLSFMQQARHGLLLPPCCSCLTKWCLKMFLFPLTVLKYWDRDFESCSKPYCACVILCCVVLCRRRVCCGPSHVQGALPRVL
jgi:hypothetical protein